MIRRMQAADIPAGMVLKEAAGWNQTEQDWANLLALEPEGCWVEEHQGEVVASTTAVCYGRELAWIGMVLVRPDFRRRGLGRGLVEHGLAWLEQRGVRQVKLDATENGLPLYEKLGFHQEGTIERWGGAKPRGMCVYGVHELELGSIAALDREAVGVDRSRLLEKLIKAFPGQCAWEPKEGFVLGRPGSEAYFLGPCSASDAETAGFLILQLTLRAAAKVFYWDLFPDQPAAAETARQLGFERRRGLIRMALRPETSVSGRPERVFAAAGFEYG
ncbi:MAG: GNAT family N-acetyltransferase [Acidobacteria bacterium]|nr:GNAT family N-acetyltransferase [Acidobacteriota bacterium]